MSRQRKNKKLHPFGLWRILILGLLCLTLAEAIACYIFDPTLFHQIADPIHQKSVAMMATGQKKLSELAQDTRTQITELSKKVGQAVAEAKQSSEKKESEEVVATPARSGDITQKEENAIEVHDGYNFNPATGDTILTGGNIDVLFFNQTAPAWKDQLYGSDKIGTHGCGPTAMAMLISSMTDYRVDPKMMADWAVQNGYYAKGDGSYHGLIPAAASTYGLSVSSCADLSAEGLLAQLRAGHVLVALMRAGHFTDSGHFIILRGITATGQVLIADPQNFDNSIQPWDAKIIAGELASRDGNGGPVWVIGSGS